MRRKKPIYTLTMLAMAFGLLLIQSALSGCSSCERKLGVTQIVVEDSIRHYYAMLQGTQLEMLWRIANVGDEPLVLRDIQPSCGCVIADPQEHYVIPPGREMLLRFLFDSGKNTGYVQHTIRLYGNIAPDGIACLIFDTNVVAPALGTPDYEEFHRTSDQFDIVVGVKELIDGNEAERGYWIDRGEYSRGYQRYPWRSGRK